MKLIDLNEIRQNIFTRSNGENIAFFTSKRSGQLPFVVVIPHDDDRYDVVAVTPTGKRTIKDVYSRRFRPDQYTDEDKTIYDLFSHYALGMSHTYTFDEFPTLIKKQSVNRSGLFTALLKMKISAAVTSKFFGEPPEDIGGDNVIQHGAATIIPVSKPTKPVIARVTGMLDSVMGLLKPIGLGDLVAGKYQLAPLTGKRIGLYDPNNDWIIINTKTLKLSHGLSTLIHEHAHKWERRSDLTATLATKYAEVRRAGHEFTGTVDLKIGDQIMMVDGPDKKIHNIPMTIDNFDNGAANGTIPWGEGKKMELGIPLEYIQKTDLFTMADGSPINTINNNDWFPTGYSMTNPGEFFAELFVVYANGNASPEVNQWFESLPRP